MRVSVSYILDTILAVILYDIFSFFLLCQRKVTNKATVEPLQHTVVVWNKSLELNDPMNCS